MQNRIDATLSAADKADVLAAITEINGKVPFLINLTKEERTELPKMGDKSRAFVQAALALAEEDDSFLPRSFDVAEMRQDEDLYAALAQVATSLTILKEKLDDTMLLIGSDLYVAALEVYAAARRSGNTQGLDQLVNALGQRFARKQKKDETPAPQPTP